MKRLLVLSLVCIGLVSGCGHSEGLPQTPSAGSSPATGCSHAAQTLADIAHGRAAAIDAAVGYLAASCYEGAQIDTAEDALAGFIDGNARTVFAAMHRHALDAYVIRETVTSTPPGLVDDPCGYATALARRITAIQPLVDFARERDIALKRLQEIHTAVASDCRSMSRPPASAQGVPAA